MHESDFRQRQEKAKSEINRLDRDDINDEPDRERFFNEVYDRADEDAALVPWADLEPKPQIKDWLAGQDGEGRSAIDIACGLGDHAEELAGAGFQTIGFDISTSAINWAQRRFPQSRVEYMTANLFDPPQEWKGGFDLVNECYTLQALPPQMVEKTMKAIAALVKTGGTLLIYTRIQVEPDMQPTSSDGPPWPLSHDNVLRFSELGFSLDEEERFAINRGERLVPHQFAVWRKLS